MKVKYYLRGLGIGIILTTLLLMLGDPKETLSDQEVISRAENLGMVMQEEDNSNLEQLLADMKPTALPADASPVPSPEASPAPSAGPTVQPTTEPTAAPTEEPAPEPTVSPAAEPTPESTAVPTGEPSATPTAAPTTQPLKPDAEPTPLIIPSGMPEAGNGQSSASEITFTVKSGMSSRKVAVLLEEVGLIDDAEGFNSYIEKSGRASIIRVGTYKMPKGSTYDEIITEITTKH